jgi:type IV pilus assembly protein PilF
MSRRAPISPRPPLSQLATLTLTALLLAACATSLNAQRNAEKKAAQSRDAAAYNVQLGIAYMNQGELARAKDKLDRAVTQDPENADVRSARAMLFQRMGDSAKADAEFRAALRLAPQDPKVVNNYAVYLCQNGRTDEGVKRFLEAARNPLYLTPEVAYTNAGVCLRAAKRDEEARTDFTRALQVRPSFAEAAFQLADLEFRRGELTSAHTLIDAFNGTYSATPDLLLLGVRVARAQGDRAAAQRYARRLQLDFPDTDQARALAALDHNPG